MRSEILEIKKIKIKEDIYPRDSCSEDLAREYANMMKAGDKFPDIYVALFKKEYILVDGRHRLEGLKILGDKYVQAEVKNNFPSIKDIYMASIRANIKHGRRLNKKDRLKIALKLRDFKFDVEDISKLVMIKLDVIERTSLGKLNRFTLNKNIKDKKIKPFLREQVKERENIKLIEEDDIDITYKENKDMFDITDLENILNIITKIKFNVDNDNISKLLRKIKKLLHKKYPKL